MKRYYEPGKWSAIPVSKELHDKISEIKDKYYPEMSWDKFIQTVMLKNAKPADLAEPFAEAKYEGE